MRPQNDINSAGQAIREFFEPLWSTPTTNSLRYLRSELRVDITTLEQVQSDDFKIEKRSGAGTNDDPYVWTEQTTGWRIDFFN